MASKIERFVERKPWAIGVGVVVASYAVGAGILFLAFHLSH
jgi:hypothetical protein